MILHKPDRKALTERLIALRRARTKPLDRANKLSWRDRFTLAAGVLVLLLLISLVVAIVLWPPF